MNRGRIYFRWCEHGCLLDLVRPTKTVHAHSRVPLVMASAAEVDAKLVRPVREDGPWCPVMEMNLQLPGLANTALQKLPGVKMSAMIDTNR